MIKLGVFILPVLVSLNLNEAVAICYNLPKPVDLSYSLEEDRLNWEPNANFKLIDKIVLEQDKPPNFSAANNFTGPEHGSTHIDAPYHFNKNGWKTSEIPLDRLISAGIIVDVRNEVQNNPDFVLLPKHLEDWETQHGSIPQGVIILVNFGWASKHHDRVAYFGNATQPYRFPGLSEAAARWIVKSGKVHGVGVDTASIDRGSSTEYAVHSTLLGSNIFGLENVALHGVNLPPKGFDIFALPMKIVNGTGAPCRIVAV